MSCSNRYVLFCSSVASEILQQKCAIDALALFCIVLPQLSYAIHTNSPHTHTHTHTHARARACAHTHAHTPYTQMGQNLRQAIHAIFRGKFESNAKIVEKIAKILLAAQKRIVGPTRTKKRVASKKASGSTKGKKRAKKGSPKPKVGSTQKGKSKAASAKGAPKAKAASSAKGPSKAAAPAAPASVRTASGDSNPPV